MRGQKQRSEARDRTPPSKVRVLVSHITKRDDHAHHASLAKFPSPCWECNGGICHTYDLPITADQRRLRRLQRPREGVLTERKRDATRRPGASQRRKTGVVYGRKMRYRRLFFSPNSSPRLPGKGETVGGIARWEGKATERREMDGVARTRTRRRCGSRRRGGKLNALKKCRE